MKWIVMLWDKLSAIADSGAGATFHMVRLPIPVDVPDQESSDGMRL